MELARLSMRDIQPSQFLVSAEKLARVLAWFDPRDMARFEPIPVRLLGGVPVMLDGHTRAVAAVRAGLERLPLCWEKEEWDWESYRRCVAACRERGVCSPQDLAGRVVPADVYAREWDDWCDRLHEAVAAGDQP